MVPVCDLKYSEILETNIFLFCYILTFLKWVLLYNPSCQYIDQDDLNLPQSSRPCL